MTAVTINVAPSTASAAARPADTARRRLRERAAPWLPAVSIGPARWGRACGAEMIALVPLPVQVSWGCRRPEAAL
jgi:hypothetical protein